MKTKKTLIGIVLMFFLTIGLKFTSAFFSDAGQSQNNTFAAADTFPTPTFVVTLTPSPSPTSLPVGPSDVIINEIMWMGSQGNSADEWIELRNMTSNTIDLSNWVIDNLGSGVNNNIVIPAGKSITPNGFFLISNDTEADSVISITPDHQTSSISLQNNGEQLILRTSAGGTILDIANGTGAWLAGDDNPEKSMERNSTPGDGAVGVSWHTATSATNWRGLDN